MTLLFSQLKIEEVKEVYWHVSSFYKAYLNAVVEFPFWPGLVVELQH
jgi:hypothetical protein